MISCELLVKFVKIYISVKTKARETKVQKIDATHFKVDVKALPIDGKANKAIIEALSDYFDIPQSQINIISGHSSKTKVVEITI